MRLSLKHAQAFLVGPVPATVSLAGRKSPLPHRNTPGWCALPPPSNRCRRTTKTAIKSSLRGPRLQLESAAFLICDVQDKFAQLPSAQQVSYDQVVSVARSLVRIAAVAKRPVVVTEQYPKVFLHTAPSVTDALDEEKSLRVSKMTFSMMVPEVRDYLADFQTFILCGLETHVCVLQTALDLLAEEKTVYLVVDGVTSQRDYDRDIALRRLEAEGAHLTTLESVVFESLKDATHPLFKRVSGILKEHRSRPAPERPSVRL
mmetsp:Transcript_2188/g.5055  ORF Transcript_2188/g.5055 Transcript_2188/m.5055 type:complete len:260 (-) Transcript_2188:1198-1977(-)